MRISDWSSDVCSSDLIEGGRDRRHSAKQLESVLANSQRLLTMHPLAVGVGQWARPLIAVVIADDFHRPRGKGGLKIVNQELARREVERQHRETCGTEIGEPARSQRFARIDDLVAGPRDG